MFHPISKIVELGLKKKKTGLHLVFQPTSRCLKSDETLFLVFDILHEELCKYLPMFVRSLGVNPAA